MFGQVYINSRRKVSALCKSSNSILEARTNVTEKKDQILIQDLIISYNIHLMSDPEGNS